MTPEPILCCTLPDGFSHDGTMRDGSLRVKTPLTYPDGSYIDVFVERNEGRNLVTDQGNTDTYLSNLGKPTKDRKGAAESCDVDLVDGEILRHVDVAESDVVAIILVAFACYTVSRNV